MANNAWILMDSSSRRNWVDRFTLEQIWDKVGEDGGLTKAQLEEDYKSIKRTPRFDPEATQTGKVGGTFVPTVFTLEAEALNDLKAVTEILDGIIENHQNHDDEEKITVIEFTKQEALGAEPEIVIRENSGGIKFENLNSIVTLGKSDWGELYGVGVFGVGLKKALRYLGKSHDIFTYHPQDETGSQLRLSESYWTQIGTAKEAVREYNGKKGVTQIVVRSLTDMGKKIEFDDELMQTLGMIYGNWLEKVPGSIKITFKNPGEEEKVLVPRPWLNESLLTNNYTNFPCFEPKIFTFDIHRDTISKVRVKMTFGLTMKGSPTYCGVTVAGNNRIFRFGDKEKYWGFGGASPYGKIRQVGHAEQTRFHCFIEIMAENPMDIPWNVGEKMGYNHNHTLHKRLNIAVQCAAKYYGDFDAVADKDDLARFPVTEGSDFTPLEIPFTKVSVNGAQYESWAPSQMEDMVTALRKVKNSKNDEKINEFYQTLCFESENDEVEKDQPVPEQKMKKQIKSENKATTKLTKTRNNKEIHKEIQKFKKLRPEHAKSAKFNGNFIPKTLKTLLKKSGLLEYEQMTHPMSYKRSPGGPRQARIMEELFFHFLRTKHLHKPDEFPEDFDKWVSSFELEE